MCLGGNVAAVGWNAVESTNRDGAAPVVLVCEHASNAIPHDLEGLGLDEPARVSHAAWDIGASDVARSLSRRLDAPLVAGGVSRLVYDANRPLEAGDAVPERSERFEVPGNAGLGPDERSERFGRVHVPFHGELAACLQRQDGLTGHPCAVVSIHSFTPRFNGVARRTELGFLHDADDRLAQAAWQAAIRQGGHDAALNEPYSAADGVTHTLALHGTAYGRPALMIEIRNDLVATAATAEAMAAHLARTLSAALQLEGALS